MAECGCLPGNAEDGWHEIRSSYCRAEELRIFAEAITRVRRAIDNGDFERGQRRPNRRTTRTTG